MRVARQQWVSLQCVRLPVVHLRYSLGMAKKRELLSAEQLDAMTPDQRAAAFRDRIVTDPDDLPEEFRLRIYERAKRLGAEHTDRS